MRLMTSKEVSLLGLTLALALAYAFWFTDWFASKTIGIIAGVRPGQVSRIPRDDGLQVYPVAFKFDNTYGLTAVKVVEVAEYATNEAVLPMWHVVAEQGPVLADTIVYGQSMKGMKPFVPGSRVQPLQPGTNYRLMVEAGRWRGATNFLTREVSKGPAL